MRTLVLRGGTYLAVRLGLSGVIGFLGVLLLTRIIGPGAYGLYMAAFGVQIFLGVLARWGIGIYLIRMESQPAPEDYHQAFSLLLITGVTSSLLALLFLPLLEAWIQLRDFGSVAMALFTGLPLHLLAVVPLAFLERELNFKFVALIELSGQLTFYIIAVGLAYLNFGVWAPVAGWWSQQILIVGLLYRTVDYHPQLIWKRNLVKQIMAYGLGYSSANWVGQLRILVPPLVLGRYLGAESVGFLNLTIRLLEALSFVKAASYRLSIAVLGRLQEDKTRTLQAINEGMRMQIMALGPLIVGFGLFAPWLIPLLFGPSWLPVLDLYPFIALSYLTNAMFNLHSSALYALKRNWMVGWFQLLQFLLIAGPALILVPRLGILGYGLAEVIAILSYGILHLSVVRYIGAPNYKLAGIWWIGFTLPLFWQDFGLWTLLGLLLILLWPGTLREIHQYIGHFKKVIHAG